MFDSKTTFRDQLASPAVINNTITILKRRRTHRKLTAKTFHHRNNSEDSLPCLHADGGVKGFQPHLTVLIMQHVCRVSSEPRTN